MKFLKKFYLAIIFIFLYSPIFVMILFSFNEGKTRAKFTGFSFKWYSSLFEHDILLVSLLNTLLVATIASILATIIGTFAALTISKMRNFNRSLSLNVINIPIVNPEIVTGISLMLLFVSFALPLGFFTLLMAHVTFCVPYVVLSVLPKIKQLNKSTYEAALDLGASPPLAFRKVVLPELMPGILSGFLLSFTLSLDDFIISYFTTGPGFPTLSITINTMTKRSIPLTVNALSTIIFIIVFILLLLINIKNKPNIKLGKM